MKNDIEWLKEEVKVFQKGENMFTAEFNAGVQQALEYVQELIDQLDETEVLSQKWIDENKVERINNLRKMTTSDVVPVEKLKNLLVPKQNNGYDAEKEKLYTVDLPHSYELIKLLHTQTYHIKNYNESGFGDYTNAFTEAEIKAIDKRYWVFAEEVVG